MNAPSPIFDTALATHKVTFSELFALITRISAIRKVGPMQIAAAYIRLATGPGKISPDDFIRLRLYDETFLRGADPLRFIGVDAHRELCALSNAHNDWIGMMNSKIASGSYLAAHGLPTIPFEKIFIAGASSVGPEVAGDAAALRGFLAIAPYPLFGKPSDSQNSLGSISLARYDDTQACVVTESGRKIGVDDLVAEIILQYPAGYVFQKRRRPHPEIAALCGDRLATVRFLTVFGENGVSIARSSWKIPAGPNGADNFWRSGNLLAQIDPADGRVERAVSGSGLDAKEHEAHPDTGARLIGFAHPQWDAMQSLAMRGARLLPQFSLIGWDIACTDEGPVIVELNLHPDSFLVQFGARRGLLDEEFMRFIELKKKGTAR